MGRFATPGPENLPMSFELRTCRTLVPFLIACSCSAGPEAGGRTAGNGGAGATSTSGGSVSVGSGGAPTNLGGGIGVTFGGKNTGNVGGGDTCAVASSDAELVKEPVDIILVLDNSGSMADELEGVEKNINVNFAKVLTDSNVDYRLILVSRHRKDARTASEEASTSVCVSAPLSGLATCPGPKPVLSNRFFQYSIKIESTNSFDQILGTYAKADSKFDLTDVGWKEWLRPGAKKVFLEMTDDNEDMTVASFLSQLTSMAPEHFGTDPSHLNFTFHSIIGIKERSPATAPYTKDDPIEHAKCEGNDNVVENAGETYQELSIKTGGLRFPLCQFDAYDTVFRTIADDVIVKSSVACDFAIPAAPAGTTLDLSKVAVKASVNGADVEYGQAAMMSACEPGAFYISQNRIFLCPQTCDSLKADPRASVDVLFKCESTIIIR